MINITTKHPPINTLISRFMKPTHSPPLCTLDTCLFSASNHTDFKYKIQKRQKSSAGVCSRLTTAVFSNDAGLDLIPQSINRVSKMRKEAICGASIVKDDHPPNKQIIIDIENLRFAFEINWYEESVTAFEMVCILYHIKKQNSMRENLIVEFDPATYAMENRNNTKYQTR